MNSRTSSFKASPYGWSAIVTEITPTPGLSSPASSYWSGSASSSSSSSSRLSSFDDYNYQPLQQPVVAHAPAPRPSAQELYEAQKRQALQAKSAKSVSSRVASLQDWAWNRWIAFISCLGGELMEPWEIAFSIILYSLVLTLAITALWRTPRYLGYLAQRAGFYLTGSEEAAAEAATEIGELLQASSDAIASKAAVGGAARASAVSALQHAARDGAMLRI